MRRQLAFALLATFLAFGCTGPQPDYGTRSPNYDPAAERDDYYPKPAPGSEIPIAVEPRDGAKPHPEQYLGRMGRAFKAFEGITAEKLQQAIDDSRVGAANEESDDAVEPQSPDKVGEESAERRDAVAPN